MEWENGMRMSKSSNHCTAFFQQFSKGHLVPLLCLTLATCLAIPLPVEFFSCPYHCPVSPCIFFTFSPCPLPLLILNSSLLACPMINKNPSSPWSRSWSPLHPLSPPPIERSQRTTVTWSVL